MSFPKRFTQDFSLNDGAYCRACDGPRDRPIDREGLLGEAVCARCGRRFPWCRQDVDSHRQQEAD